jgi:hypothetical protein
MRTTVTIPDALLAKAKRRAEQEGVTVSDLIEEALRDRLLRAQPAAPERPFRLVTFGQQGLQPGVSYDDLKHLDGQQDADRLEIGRVSRAADEDAASGR